MQNKKSDQHFDLIIVGAGLVGASLACALANTDSGRQLRIGLLEAGESPQIYRGKEFDPRVVALTKASHDFLQQIQVWDAIQAERVCAFADMHVWDGEGTAEIHFSSADVRQDCLGHILENSVCVRVLREHLARCSNIEWIQPIELINLTLAQLGRPWVELELAGGERISADLLIAADGAQSQVRRLAGFPTREWDYGQTAIVTSVRTELSHQHTAWQRFMNSGPLAFLPLQDEGDTHQSSIVWSADTALAEKLMTLDDAEFCAALGFAFEHKLGTIEGCAERFHFPLRQRHATSYIQPGLALVGDAAHSIHPLAGQGVNLGIADAEALAGEIQRALARGIPLADYSILRRYQRQRLTANLAMMSAMEGFKRLFGNSSPGLTWLRNAGVRQLNSLPLLKNFIVKQVMGF